MTARLATGPAGVCLAGLDSFFGSFNPFQTVTGGSMFRKMWFLCLALILAACQGGPLFHLGPTATLFPDKFTGTA
jgi:hypothetical protein